MFCTKCGNRVLAESLFCHKCGLELSNPKQAVEVKLPSDIEQVELQGSNGGSSNSEVKTKDNGLLIIIGVVVFLISIIFIGLKPGTSNWYQETQKKSEDRKVQDSDNSSIDWQDYLQKLRSCELAKEVGAPCVTSDGKVVEQTKESLSVVIYPSYNNQQDVNTSPSCVGMVSIYSIINNCTGVKGTDDYWLGRATVLRDISDGVFTTLTYQSAKNSRVICTSVLEAFISTYGENRSNQEFADFFLGCRYMVVERLAPYGTSFETG